MLLDIRTPPKLTGDDKKDITALNNWCNVMLRNMMMMFRNIDSDNITELSSSKLVGMIDAALIPTTASETTALMSLDEEAETTEPITEESEVTTE